MTKVGTDLVIAKLDSARMTMYEASTIPEAKRFVDIGVTAETWAKQQKLGDEITSYAHAFTIDALANLGRMLKATPRNEGRAGKGRPSLGGAKSEPRKDDTPTLADLGLDKKTSSIAQKLASLPEKQLAAVREANTSVTAALQVVGKPHVSNNSGENEWYTPLYIIERARKAMGAIDCDPASNALANKNVKADVFYTAQQDGLTKKWRGRVWLNPPYSNPLCSQFCESVTSRFLNQEIEQACVLVNNATETEWFSKMHSASSAVCFLDGRVKYLDKTGTPANTPLQGQAVLYFGKRVVSFCAAFSNAGRVTVLHG